MAGTGNGSTDGKRGVGNVQTNNLVKLLFAQIWNPGAEYNLSVNDLSELGRLILHIVDRNDPGFNPNGLHFIKSDIFKFVRKSYLNGLYLYCPLKKTDSKQYLPDGK